MLRAASSEEKNLDDGDASMMMIIDETTMSMDDADKTLMMNDDELMMDDDETNKVKDETRIRCYPNDNNTTCPDLFTKLGRNANW